MKGEPIYGVRINILANFKVFYDWDASGSLT